jgi:hypothetical protein
MHPFNIITQIEPSNTKRYKWASAIVAYTASRRSWKSRLDREAEMMVKDAPRPNFGLQGRCKRPPLCKIFKNDSFFLMP